VSKKFGNGAKKYLYPAEIYDDKKFKRHLSTFLFACISMEYMTIRGIFIFSILSILSIVE